MVRIAYRKTYNGRETIDIRAGNGEDLRAIVAAMAKNPCGHELIELLSINGHNLDGAARKCARCGAEMKK